MNVEIVTIGDEILNGFTVNTNVSFISTKIAELGFSITRHITVADTLNEIEETLRQSIKRSPIVIVTGGLGATEDDITKRAIVKVFKRNLVYHDDIMQEMKKKYEARGITMPAVNQNQALLPQGAKFFPNKNGSAVGICIAENNSIFIALPGVPHEMEQILTDEVIPYLSNLNIDRKSKTISLHTTGISESKLSEMFSGKFRSSQNFKLAYLPHFSGVTLRITATATTADSAKKLAEKKASEIENICGDFLFGRDDETLESVIGKLLIDNDKTLSVAESCTAGSLGMIVTDSAGSSAYFEGGLISYSNQVKEEKLGVSTETLENHGAVSEECAIEMAAGARKMFGTHYALSITGIAGPGGGTEEKPVGTTYIALNSAHASYARKFLFGNNRTVNRNRASYAALEILRREILGLVNKN